MKKCLVFFYFLILTATIYGQDSVTKPHVLIPLDWQVTECGRPYSKHKENCQLTINNNTDRVIQGYLLTLYGELKIAYYVSIGPGNSKEFKRHPNEILVFADSLLNAVGGFELKSGHNQINIDASLFANSRKLNRQITDTRETGTSSGGSVIKEQAAYDVLKYDLELEIFPDQKFIRGVNIITAKSLAVINSFVFDLDTLLRIDHVSLRSEDGWMELPFELKSDKYWATLPSQTQIGQTIAVRIAYEGNPRTSTYAPYKAGFSWNTTNTCEHWIATSCQIDGADLWFPCKDYQWDEADSVDLSFTVPKGLSAISNGVLIDSIHLDNGTTTFNWKVLNPINNYGIALNIAPYEYISDEYTSITGEELALGYWVLPENIERAKAFYPFSKKYLQFLEFHLGPYPFRNEKLGIVEVPFVGMEHQTIIAMGPNYELQYPAYNKTLFHEICHEWFGNLVTASDWNSFWIQESFDGYMECLYEEAVFGEDAYRRRLKRFRKFVRNKIPLAPDGTPNSREVYNGDSYSKGTFLLHSLRYLIGKEKLLRVIRRMAYRDESKESKTDGTQCRFTSTDEFFDILEAVSGQDFGWFEQVYFKNAELPVLEVSEEAGDVVFRWKVAGDIEFNMPLEISTEEGIVRVDFVDNVCELGIDRKDILEIDPGNWVLMEVRWLDED